MIGEYQVSGQEQPTRLPEETVAQINVQPAFQGRDTESLDSVPEQVSPSAELQTEKTQPTLSQAVEDSVVRYLETTESRDITQLYELVLSEIEAPLLQAVMKQTGRNQSRASTLLGLNRGTLRKKLKKYGLV